ncbi:HIT-like protein [Aspergillus japonicus CBS 114.51]|uniref:Bis(5'-adenosyl)-triphosphatase n=2 Tax=Aspergillus TaxID=5052 RepID=A0A2V5HBQ7_ASPV1|nr:HIT-like protein [Aspergillus japonicus CBS 114.51]PYI13360.1 HIT-like protein [Aspergillus violaceofuscus CBS 115571]RAH79358.1 HIT-like protein [Aspergillus japonicus CBS 114.51]
MATAIRNASPIHFGPFPVTTQVFHLTRYSYALVNLKPILPGHVLVSPRRGVPRVADLTPPEASDLFLTVRRVARMVERVYGASSLNIAIQDGVDAGQSVPHVHAHVIPRKKLDLEARGGVDAVYELLEGEEGDLGRILRKFPKVDDEDRHPRSLEEMEQEARFLMREMEMEKEGDE